MLSDAVQIMRALFLISIKGDRLREEKSQQIALSSVHESYFNFRPDLNT